MKIQIDTTLERDIDLLIIEEFISDESFARIFLTAVGISEPYIIEEAIHSKTDATLGESDIVFILNTSGKRHALHFEDKIDAMAMPEQHNRYILRAQKDIAGGQYDSFSVLIVAPNKYLSHNKEAQKYIHRVSYEQMLEHYSSRSDTRSKYKSAIIERAIFEQKSGYQYEANPCVVEFCAAMTVYQREKYPGLPTGTVAWWPGYTTLLKDTVTVFKADKGFCDLQFGHTSAQDLFARTKKYLAKCMTVVQTGKSASVRIIVSPIRFENRFEDEIEKVDEALAAIAQLYALSEKIAEIDLREKHEQSKPT